jgi:predicted metalloprotease with PDZ domain
LSIRSDHLPDAVEIAFPDRVAGRTGFLEAITSIHATDEAGRELAVLVEGASAFVGVQGGQALYLSYQIAPRDRDLTHASRFRAIGSADRFFSFGHAIVAQPLNLNPDFDRNARVTVHAEDGVWQIRSTLPLDEAHSINQLVDAGYFAGRFEHVQRARGGRTVDLWIEESIASQPQTLADLALAVVEAQADLLGEAANGTRVVVLRRADDVDARTGSGRAGGFILEVGDNVDARTDGLTELIAHENFHRLNGHTLTFAARDQLQTMWFREGVTDFVSMQNAAARGLIEESTFFRYLGRAIAAYLNNPARQVPMSSMSEDFWTNRDMQRFPYDHGAIAALLIELELRRTGGGTVEGFFGYLGGDASALVLPLTNAAIRDALERYSGASWTAFFDEHILGGEPLPVFSQLNEIGLEVVERVEPAPYYGFRTSITVDGGWFVSQVDAGSPSAAAGVYPGMELRSEPYVPQHSVDATARLDEVTNRGIRTIQVQAGQGQRRAFALTAAEDSYRAWFGFGDE